MSIEYFVFVVLVDIFAAIDTSPLEYLSRHSIVWSVQIDIQCVA